MIIMLHNWICGNEYTPKRWRGVAVNLSRKGNNADPGKYRGMTLLSIGGESFCKVRIDRVGTMLENAPKNHRGASSFWTKT